MNKNLERKTYETRDEYYTTPETTERFLVKCKQNQFKDMVVYCNCDGPNSEIYKLLKQRFNYYGIKQLIASCYAKTGHGIKTIFDGTSETIENLDGDGNYKSPECEELLKRCDVVITNPPFSKLNDFIQYVMEHGKELLLIINTMSLMYKNIFPYAFAGKFCVIQRFSGGATFKLPNGDIAHVQVCGISTMLDLTLPLKWHLYTTQQLKDKGKFILADGTQTLECKYIADIPIDYEDDIFVPTSVFLLQIIRKYFDIIRVAKEGVKVNGKNRFHRVVIRKRPNIKPEDILTLKGTNYVKA